MNPICTYTIIKAFFFNKKNNTDFEKLKLLPHTSARLHRPISKLCNILQLLYFSFLPL